MIERPILFNGEMVRAVLDGRKTQTRRIVKPQPQPNGGKGLHPVAPYQNQYGQFAWVLASTGHGSGGDLFSCPLGQVGDHLWVRETWGVISHSFNGDGDMIEWTPDRPATKVHELKHGRGYYTGHVIYSADGDQEWAGDDDGGGEPRSAWHPSIHMPRSASRITLEITNVRIERLQDIRDEDAIAEGINAELCEKYTTSSPSHSELKLAATHAYAGLWDSIYKNWNSNPWVWVIEFKRIEA